MKQESGTFECPKCGIKRMGGYLKWQSREKDGIKRWILGGDGFFEDSEFFWQGNGFWSSPEDCWIKTGGKTTEEWNSMYLCKKCSYYSFTFLDFIKVKENTKKVQRINKNKLFPKFNNLKNSASENNKITISIISVNQKIQNYERTYEDTKIFCDVEKELYEEYPEFKDFETFFIVGGTKIKRFKTLKENNISNGDVIILNIFDD